MIRTSAPLALFAVLLIPACCAAPEDMKQKTPEGPQFDAAYYAKNAKEYIDSGRYGQAKDQWQKQLTKDPDNYMARVGIAYCDLYMSEDAMVQRRSLEDARKHLKDAEKGFRGVWGNHVEADTESADPKRPQWKAALGLALTMRALGYVDRLDSQRNLEMAKRGGDGASKAADRAAELSISSDQAYQDSINLFQQLAYMQHASPESIRNLGELYVVTKQDALAEQEFRRYLDIAGRSYEEYEKRKSEMEKQAVGPEQQEAIAGAWEAKLASNAKKQVSVMVDLAQLNWDRGEYTGARELLQNAIKIQPDRKDLYLKLAQAEDKLNMQETALMNIDEFLKRSSKKREEFDDTIREALKLRQEIEQKLKARGAK